MTYSHLDPEVARIADLPNAERIAFGYDDRWVTYPKAEEALALMLALVNRPRTIRPGSLLLAGNPANGKSTLVRQFMRRFSVTISDAGRAIQPVVRVEIPGTGKPRAIWSALLKALAVSHSERDSAEALFARAKTNLELSGTRAIVVDEFHNIAEAGKGSSSILASFKELSNAFSISLIAAGIKSSEAILTTERQTESRFTVFRLTGWSADADYGRFIATYERLLPLKKPSHLCRKVIIQKLHELAGTEIGHTVELLRTAAEIAIVSGEECITLETIMKAGRTHRVEAGAW